MVSEHVVIPKTWRSELRGLALFFVLCIVSIYLTGTFGWVFEDDLFTIGGKSVILTLPVFWFLPALMLLRCIVNIYNVRYLVDSRGIETKIGILAVNQRITRVRYEDIRSVETEQTVLERIMNIGQVEIGTAATGEIEILFKGIAAPLEVQDMIQRERDRRQKVARAKSQPQYQAQVNA